MTLAVAEALNPNKPNHTCTNEMVIKIIFFQLSTVALCGNETKAPSDNLLHTTAVGKNDTLHYIFSTHGTPAVLVARTDNNATLHLNCTEFFSENVNESKSSIFFSHHHYAFAILFQRVWKFNYL